MFIIFDMPTEQKMHSQESRKMYRLYVSVETCT